MIAILINPDGPKQDLEGLRKYLEVYKNVEIEEKKTYVQINCPDNFVNAIIMLVRKYGYWASEYGDPKNYKGK